MVPSLISAIKSEGLVLVTDQSLDAHPTLEICSGSPRHLPEGIDGLLKSNGVLKFVESIDM